MKNKGKTIVVIRIKKQGSDAAAKKPQKVTPIRVKVLRVTKSQNDNEDGLPPITRPVKAQNAQRFKSVLRSRKNN